MSRGRNPPGIEAADPSEAHDRHDVRTTNGVIGL
eukprot:gene8393-biopygen14645